MLKIKLQTFTKITLASGALFVVDAKRNKFTPAKIMPSRALLRIGSVKRARNL